MIGYRNNIRRTLSRVTNTAWFLALIPSILIGYFVVTPTPRIELVAEKRSSIPDAIAYADLNGDGITEVVQSGRGHPPGNYLVILDNQMRYHEQWNFTGAMDPKISQINTGDYDDDGLGEIYLFTLRTDSLCLNVFELFDKNGTTYQNQFITRFRLVNGANTSTLNFLGFFDQDGNGRKELYFGITTGFGLEPRSLYYFDVAERKLVTSAFTGVNVNMPVFYDTDRDRRPEIYGVMTASGNYKTPTPFSDNSTWLMIYNDQLRFLFDPIEFRGFANALYIHPIEYNGGSYFVAAHMVNGADTTVMPAQLQVRARDGTLLRKKLISEFCASRPYEVASINNKAVLVVADVVYVLDGGLNIIKEIDLGIDEYAYAKRIDIEHDGRDELLLYSKTHQKLWIINDQWKIAATLNVDFPEYDWNYSYITDADGTTLFVDSGNAQYTIASRKNPLYWLMYVYYLLVYGLILGFVMVIRHLNSRQVIRRESLRKRILSIQLQSIRGQLDPHFTFNALNSVAALLYDEKRDSAYDALNLFTRLLRQTVNDSGKIYRSLEEEVRFVRGYLDLEKIRFGDKLQYRIDIGSNVMMSELMPKLVLQTFVENAVKHGIMPLETGGHVHVVIERKLDTLVIEIEDNGIGRRAAQQNPTSGGKGLKLTSEFFDVLNEITPDSMHYAIFDLEDETPPRRGTRVVVTVNLSALRDVAVDLNTRS